MLKILVVLIGGILKSSDTLLPPDNVCKTFFGYYTNQGCYDNPDHVLELTCYDRKEKHYHHVTPQRQRDTGDVGPGGYATRHELNQPDIVRRYGFNVEEYQVTTEDGYILSIFRIPSDNPNSTPVFLQHGIYASGITFLLAGNNSLGFVLAKAGYDVWLGNARGTRYSRNHISLSNKSLQYWNFSLHELGLYDTASQVGLVYEKTNKPVVYIGYSLGSVSGTVYSIMYPALSSVTIKTMISLAPTSIMDIRRSSLKFLSPFWGLIQTFVNRFFHGELFERGGAMSQMVQRICLPLPNQMLPCQLFMESAFGLDIPQINPETLPITLKQDGDSVSMKTIIHQSQIVKKRRFQYFDYGPEKNKELYGSIKPPAYNVSSILVPNYLIYGKGDFVATERSVYDLYNQFSDVARKYGIYAIEYPNFAHTDFTAAIDVKTLLYDHLIEFMSKL